jgi:gamma-glutamyltranspeptidase / glutathione hydrolase
MLRILEPLNLSAMEHNSVMYVHHLVEAKKLAYEDRARFYADPDFADVPVSWLVSEEHASNLRNRLDPKRAAHEVVPDTVPGRRGDTVYLTVVDTAGNAVSLIQSIYKDFGSGLVPPDLGFALQNRGCLFHLDPSHANAFRPGKRPFHTLMPGFATRGGEPVFSFGVMGGDMQPQGQLQVFLNIVEFGMDVQLAGEALRCRHDGSSTPTGQVMKDGGTVKLERGFSDGVIEGLRSKGHHVETAEHGFGGYQGIWIDPKTGIRSGGSEPRKDGLARGL